MTLASVLTIVLVSGLAWDTWRSYRDNKGVTERAFRMEDLRVKIMYFDQALTTAANMAAATGNPRWEAYHEEFEPQLDTAIRQLRSLVPQKFDFQAATRLDQANAKLVEMENRVFRMVADGRRDEALRIMASDEYRQTKTLYSDSLQQLTNELSVYVSREIKENRERAMVAVISGLGGVPLLSFMWAWVLKDIRSYLKQRDQAEEMLRDSEERFRSLVVNIPGAVYRCGTEYPWPFTHISEAVFDITGYHADELVGHGFPGAAGLIVAEDLAGVKSRVAEAVDAHGFYELTCRIRRRDGSIRWHSGKGRPIYDRDGKPLWLDGIMLDITERKWAEQEREQLLATLERKNQELQTVVYVASHDLRSPLVNIQGFSTELAGSCKQIVRLAHSVTLPDQVQRQLTALINEDIPESLGFIQAGITKMESLLSGLLQISRVGTASFLIEKLDMNEMMDLIIKNMQFQITNSGAEVTVDDLPRCTADRGQTSQVFTNLLGNAIKYLDPARKGAVHVSGSVEGPDAVYCVEDNGIGIAPEHLPRIFELFHRLEPMGPVAGEGLGLTIARRILDRQGGRIWAESQPGKGSRFFVSLPKA